MGRRLSGAETRLEATLNGTPRASVMQGMKTEVDYSRLDYKGDGFAQDSFSLAVDAAKDCLSYSRFDPLDIDIIINCSITKFDKNLNYQFDPPLSLFVRESIGAKNAQYFDVMNACAGMFTGIYILDNYIRSGIIKRGMVVSGEYASSIASNASQEADSCKDESDRTGLHP